MTKQISTWYDKRDETRQRETTLAQIPESVSMADSGFLRLLDRTPSHPPPPVVVVVITIDDLNDDRSLRAMSVIADHVLPGASNPPLQTRQTTTTTPEPTSRQPLVVTRVYESHPAMINPLAFGHPQLQPSLYPQSPLSESNNPGDNNHTQCMSGKPQDQQR